MDIELLDKHMYSVTIEDISSDEMLEKLFLKSVSENKTLILSPEVVKHFWQNGLKSKYWWKLTEAYSKLHKLI